eukprot:2776866-Pyramimonas_sp.AAC.1
MPTTRGVPRRNSCQYLQGNLLRSRPRAGLRPRLGLHRALGANSLQARLQSIRMDPQLYQAGQATSLFASPRPACFLGPPSTPEG